MVNTVLAFELKAITAEIEEQADIQPCGDKVIDELGFVPRVEKLAGFEFQNDRASDQDVGHEIADRLLAV